MKILTWNEDKKMYSIRTATKAEEAKVNDAIKLFKECKKEYYRIIDDANKEYGGELDLYIDNEVYFAVQDLHQKLRKVEEMTKGLIELNVNKYYFLT